MQETRTCPSARWKPYVRVSLQFFNDNSWLTKFYIFLERSGTKTLTIVPTSKLVKDVIIDLKTVAANEEQKSESAVTLI